MRRHTSETEVTRPGYPSDGRSPRTLFAMVNTLDWLEGTWEGTGVGEYPTIETFTYHETITLAPLADKPVLAYTQRTRSPNGQPLHAESGFLRFDDEGVELVVAQPTGIAETHRGSVTGTRIEFEPSGLITTPTAVEVKSVRRWIEIEGDTMNYQLHMEAVGQPMTLHLTARLERR